jgi:hypothetical protein
MAGNRIGSGLRREFAQKLLTPIEVLAGQRTERKPWRSLP